VILSFDISVSITYRGNAQLALCIAAMQSSASAEESPERFEHAARERKRFLRPIRRLLRKRPLRTAVHLAGNIWYLVDGQIDVVSGAGRAATGGGKLI
jgi:hypothetical protein